ncbi:MAG: hypothetical protein A2017_16500 [Lentisphaerae bacterium GWF2_44_16]|nr:MAG: hypothetical protein A2017_16500 [Lentisphaerae bacterium GWF2_44_16]
MFKNLFLIAVSTGACFIAKISAAENAGQEKKTDYDLCAFTWEKPVDGTEHLIPMIWTGWGKRAVRRIQDPVKAAQTSIASPKGKAAVFIWSGMEIIGYPGDKISGTEFPGPWMENGIPQVRKQAEEYFKAYKEAGGLMDFLVLDFEGGFSMWDRKPARIEATFNSPRFVEFKGQLPDMKPSEITSDTNPPSYQLGEKLSDLPPKPYMIWNTFMEGIVSKGLNEAIFDPVVKLFPKVRASNYNSFWVKGDNVYIDYAGHITSNVNAVFGNCNCPVFYGNFHSGLAKRTLSDGTIFGDSPFSVLRREVDDLRAIARSSTEPCTPWISYKSYTKSKFKDNDYYQELVYHLALSGVRVFLVWNAAPWKHEQTMDEWRKESDDLILDSCLRTLNKKLQGSVHECVTLGDSAWNGGILVSGMKLDAGRTLWRITVPAWDVKVKVLPSGEILSTNKSIGLWYESQGSEGVSFEAIK